MNKASDPQAHPGFRLALSVVLGIAFLAWVILPSLPVSTRAKLPQISSNLQRIDLAKQMWASDYAATNGATVPEQDLVEYLRPRPGSTGLVEAVDSEVYRRNAVGTPPEARLERAFGSRFPKGTLVRWRTNVGCEILLPNGHGGTNDWQPLYSRTNRISPTAAPRRSP